MFSCFYPRWSNKCVNVTFLAHWTQRLTFLVFWSLSRISLVTCVSSLCVSVCVSGFSPFSSHVPLLVFSPRLLDLSRAFVHSRFHLSSRTVASLFPYSCILVCPFPVLFWQPCGRCSVCLVLLQVFVQVLSAEHDDGCSACVRKW